MRIETVDGLLTPGEIAAARQDWRRDAFTWRERFFALFPKDRLPGVHPKEVADTLEDWFKQLPNNTAISQ